MGASMIPPAAHLFASRRHGMVTGGSMATGGRAGWRAAAVALGSPVGLQMSGCGPGSSDGARPLFLAAPVISVDAVGRVPAHPGLAVTMGARAMDTASPCWATIAARQPGPGDRHARGVHARRAERRHAPRRGGSRRRERAAGVLHHGRTEGAPHGRRELPERGGELRHEPAPRTRRDHHGLSRPGRRHQGAAMAASMLWSESSSDSSHMKTPRRPLSSA